MIVAQLIRLNTCLSKGGKLLTLARHTCLQLRDLITWLSTLVNSHEPFERKHNSQ